MSKYLSLATEQINKKTENIDRVETIEMVALMNEIDHEVATCVKQQLNEIAQAIEIVVSSFKKGGRLFYIGAGTSGRLGVLDASECPPTFGVSPDMVQGIIAGGSKALTTAVEEIEDMEDAAVADLKNVNLNERDVVLAISACGCTPYCISGLRYGKTLHAACINLSCNTNSEMAKWADVSIEVNTGPEVITGSTRLKAGTAQKLVLNMISTISMIKIGKVYKNLMVDVKATNNKLVDRLKRIVMLATDINNEKEVLDLLGKSDGDVKTAIVMKVAKVDIIQAQKALNSQNGVTYKAIELLKN